MRTLRIFKIALQRPSVPDSSIFNDRNGFQNHMLHFIMIWLQKNDSFKIEVVTIILEIISNPLFPNSFLIIEPKENKN